MGSKDEVFDIFDSLAADALGHGPDKKEVPLFYLTKIRRISHYDDPTFDILSAESHSFPYYDASGRKSRAMENYFRDIASGKYSGVTPRLSVGQLQITFNYAESKSYTVSAVYKFFKSEDYVEIAELLMSM